MKKVAENGRATLERLNRETATWKMIFDTPNPAVRFQITTIRSPTMREISVERVLVGVPTALIRIIERDNVWYVTDSTGAGKYRPYEAPLSLPVAYQFIALSDIRSVDENQPGKFESQQANIATYRVPLAEPQRQQMQQALKSFEFARQAGGEAAITDKKIINQLSELRDRGFPMDIDVENGIVASGGALQHRFDYKDFHWLPDNDPNRFAVDASKFKDHTASMLGGMVDPDELILVGHAVAPGFEADANLVNTRTGELRRIPYPNGITMTGCFSKDRRSVFFCGHDAPAGSWGIYQCDIATGVIRQLGENSGFSHFPTVSPDGKTLAVAGNFGMYSNVLASQVFLYDLPTGRGRPRGEPLDTAYLSWLADGSGLVLITRDIGPDINKPSIETIALMDLNGKVTPIRLGSNPIVLNPSNRILFEDSDKLWKTCDLNGKNVALVGDGLRHFNSPTPSPDSKRLIMMPYADDTDPRPVVVDIAKGTTTRLKLGRGIWFMPAWR